MLRITTRNASDRVVEVIECDHIELRGSMLPEGMYIPEVWYSNIYENPRKLAITSTVDIEDCDTIPSYLENDADEYVCTHKTHKSIGGRVACDVSPYHQHNTHSSWAMVTCPSCISVRESISRTSQSLFTRTARELYEEQTRDEEAMMARERTLANSDAKEQEEFKDNLDDNWYSDPEREMELERAMNECEGDNECVCPKHTKEREAFMERIDRFFQ